MLSREVIAGFLASALNKHLSAAHRLELSKFEGKVVGCRYRRLSTNWRVQPDGGFLSVSPLISADVLFLAENGAVRLEGDAKLLRLLSDIWNTTDWAVVVSGAFGPVFAPRLLLLIERGRAALADALQRQTASAEEVATYGEQVETLWRDINRLSGQLSAISGGR